jgi:hypothetical protein
MGLYKLGIVFACVRHDAVSLEGGHGVGFTSRAKAIVSEGRLAKVRGESRVGKFTSECIEFFNILLPYLNLALLLFVELVQPLDFLPRLLLVFGR